MAVRVAVAPWHEETARMMETAQTIELVASPRQVTGKAVNRLRRAGIIPANVFGHGRQSLAVQVEAKEFERVFRRAGLNRVFSLVLDGAPRSVLIRGVARERISRAISHVDFQEVSLDEPIKATVPIVLTGEPSTPRKDVVVMRLLDHITVEGLPTKLPGAVHADVARLSEPDEALHVRDLDVPEGVRVLDSGDEPVAKLAVVAGEVEEVTPAPEPAEAPVAAPEGERPAEKSE